MINFIPGNIKNRISIDILFHVKYPKCPTIAQNRSDLILYSLIRFYTYGEFKSNLSDSNADSNDSNVKYRTGFLNHLIIWQYCQDTRQDTRQALNPENIRGNFQVTFRALHLFLVQSNFLRIQFSNPVKINLFLILHGVKSVYHSISFIKRKG